MTDFPHPDPMNYAARLIHELANTARQLDKLYTDNPWMNDKQPVSTGNWLPMSIDEWAAELDGCALEWKDLASKTNGDLPQWKREFQSFKAEWLPTIPDSWVDCSYRNDMSPSWHTGKADLYVFVNNPDPTLREWEGSSRYMALRTEHNCDVVIDTDDWQELLAAIEAFQP